MSEKPVQLTFGSLEAVLAVIHGIADSKRTAFQARLKNFHRLGFPLDFETIKGKAAVYHPGHMVEMGLVLEMTQLGLSPERLVKVLIMNRFPTFMAIRMAASWLVAAPQGFDAERVRDDDPASMFLFFDPAALRGLMLDDPALTPDLDQTDDTFFYGGEGVVRENFIKWTSGGINRLSLINVTSLIDMIAGHVCPVGGENPEGQLAWRKAFFEEVARWADEKTEETYEHDAAFFLERLLENGYITRESADAEAWIAQLVEETGFKSTTVHSAFLNFATDRHEALMSSLPTPAETKNGDR